MLTDITKWIADIWEAHEPSIIKKLVKKTRSSNAIFGTEDKEVWIKTGRDGEDINTYDEEA
ncbi:hypothetical protein HZS_517 [Henneguya salminicola]|nr:hypothetical protein HZS_517 [Henneguya salminicola]